MAVIGSAEVLVRPSFKGMQTAARKAGVGAGGAAGQSMTSRMGSALVSWGKKAAKVGAVAAGAAIGATIVGGVRAAMSQQASTLVLSGLYDSAKLAEKTMEGLGKVSKDSPLGGDAFRKGAESLAYAGVQGDEAVKSLDNVGRAIVGSGGSADQMRQFTDGILNMVNSGRVGLDSLNQVSQAGVPIFSSLAEKLGVSMEEVRDMASDGKLELSDVLDILENADTEGFQQSLRAGEEAQKSFTNTAKTLWNEVTETLGERLQPALQWATDKFRDLAEKVGPALSTWLDKATVKIKDFVQGWQDGEGAGGKFRDILTNLRDAAQDLWSVFQDRVLPVLQRLGSWLTDNPNKIKAVVGAFIAWKVAVAGVRLAGFLATLGSATIAFVKQTAVLLTNTGAWVASKAAKLGAAVATKAVAAAQLVAAGASKALAAGQRILNAVMAMNPIGLVVAALALLVAAFVTAYKNSETFRRIVDAAWKGIKKAAEVVWTFLKDKVFIPLAKFVKAAWAHFQTMKDKVTAAWDTMKRALKVAWDWIKTNIFDVFKAVVKAVRDDFKNKVDAIKGAWDSIKNAFKAVWDWIKTNIFDPWKRIFKVVADTFKTQVGNIKTAWDGIKTSFKKVWDWIRDHVFAKFKAGLTLLKNAVTTAKDNIKRAWEKVANIFRKPINWVLRTVWDGGIKKAFDSVAKLINWDKRLPSSPQIPAFAKGGLHRRGWALVGEEGPELVNFSKPGRVYTAGQTAGMSIPSRDLSPAESRAAAGRSPAEATVPMGGWWDSVKGSASRAWDATMGWVRGSMADAAAFLLSPLRKTIMGSVAQWGDAGAMGGHTATFAMDQLVKWIRGKDKEDAGTGLDGGAPGKQSGKWRRPTAGSITSRYGARWGGFHGGIDISNGGGLTYAAQGGKVLKTGWNIRSGFTGIGILLDHLNGWQSYYGHNPSMGAVKVRPGQSVSQGQRIGQQGATGNATGPHLHFSTWHNGRLVNPTQTGLFDDGGLLKPGMAAYHSASMRKPDAVLNASQWADIHHLAAGAGGGVVDMSDESLDRLARIVARTARNISVRATDDAFASAGRGV